MYPRSVWYWGQRDLVTGGSTSQCRRLQRLEAMARLPHRVKSRDDPRSTQFRRGGNCAMVRDLQVKQQTLPQCPTHSVVPT